MKEPDLAIIDLNMPEMDGVENHAVAAQGTNRELRALILTLESDEQTIIELFRRE